jgi:hypothetical protein
VLKALSVPLATGRRPIADPSRLLRLARVVACGILNAETGGDLMYFGTLSAQKTIDEGDTVTFATAALQVSET